MNPAPGRTAADLCADVVLDEEAMQLLRDDQEPRAFLDALLENQRYSDAAKFLARSLAKRSAVRWACSCVRSESGSPSTAEDLTCLECAERWVAGPTDANRCAALEAAERAGYCTPCAWTAAAAGWTGGSLSPPDLPPVAPPDHLTAQAVAGAMVVLAAVKPEAYDERMVAFLQTGLAFWDES